MKTLYIIRGVPGSGKTTYAKKLAAKNGINHYEADMYFVNKKGEYRFDPTELNDAHYWCKSRVSQEMREGKSVIVSNTFTRLWEIEGYIDIACDFNYKIVIIHCTKEYGNIHEVPESKVKAMKKRFENKEKLEEQLGVSISSKIEWFEVE